MFTLDAAPWLYLPLSRGEWAHSVVQLRPAISTRKGFGMQEIQGVTNTTVTHVSVTLRATRCLPLQPAVAHHHRRPCAFLVLGEYRSTVCEVRLANVTSAAWGAVGVTVEAALCNPEKKTKTKPSSLLLGRVPTQVPARSKRQHPGLCNKQLSS